MVALSVVVQEAVDMQFPFVVNCAGNNPRIMSVCEACDRMKVDGKYGCVCVRACLYSSMKEQVSSVPHLSFGACANLERLSEPQSLSELFAFGPTCAFTSPLTHVVFVNKLHGECPD